MPTQLACDQIVQRFQAMNTKVTSLVAAPLAMLMAADALSSQVTGYGASKFSTLDQMLNTLGNLDTSVPGLISGLSELLECPAIQQSAQGTAIETILDTLGNGATLDNAMLQTITNPIKGAFGDLKNKALKNDPAAAIGNVASGAASFLKASGALGMLAGLNTLAQCAAAVCDTAKSDELRRIASDVKSSVRLTDAGEVSPESTMTPEVQGIIAQNKATVAAKEASFLSLLESKFGGLL